MKNYGLISKKVDKILHGADYNPEQWLHMPGIWEEDCRLMKVAGCNVVSVGMFSWTELEPEEGRYNFDWLDKVMDMMAENGIHVILSTPSGAKPNWMADKYPEIRRVNAMRQRELKGSRHNHCYTSPVYREKVYEINRRLAERYKKHQALIMWHVSNEYEGQCHCQLCQEEFRRWLREKYKSLDNLNRAWWAKFWSHTYTDWSQIESPSPIGEMELHGLNLDWNRFITDKTVDFFRHEAMPLREITPDIPLTTNFHDFINLSPGLNLHKFIPYLDVVSWDNYPYWHHGERTNWREGVRRAFIHDINRAFKGGKPFMMMESSPSATNWQPVAKLRRPGMHSLQSMQAVAHGSDTVQYFQWRKSLGSSEKLHGAVLDHYATDKTRVFREVADLGRELAELNDVAGTSVKPQVAIIYDWENCWALNDAQGPRQEKKEYFETCVSHYEPFWKMGIPVDVTDTNLDMSMYKIVVAPMLYMMSEEFGRKAEHFVAEGGVLITTYLSGIANETDLCHTNGRPGPLRNVSGIWSEEIDALYDGQYNTVVVNGDGWREEGYRGEIFCDIIHAEGCQVLGEYKDDFYAGYPALTVNEYGRGRVYYIAFRSYDTFLDDFYKHIVDVEKLHKILDTYLPEGVTVQLREDENNRFYFLQNFADERKEVIIPETLADVLKGGACQGTVVMEPYSYMVLRGNVY